ncbi:Phosphodiest-domain-containing protein [Agrocybe pediades]|nr:Phosphodiest-domain-containing protein [Agrocybe pediades]
MATSSSRSPKPSVPRTPKQFESEERRGLLNTGEDDHDEFPGSYQEDASDSKSWSRRRITLVAASVIGLLVTGTLARTALFGNPIRMPQHTQQQATFSGDVLRSNGTENFKRTVVIVSIDGLRADYLDRGLTPHLLNLSKKGLRAKSMQPIFPTLTFPNHWALMTGLYAESHGIVANNFWDPASEEEFHYNRISSAWNPTWWLGEPMWETAEKSGVVSANLMWPGPPKTTSGASSTYFVPWKDHVPLEEKLDQILHWIDLPLRERPQLIMAYEPSLDQAGHATGPYSKRVNETLVKVDTFAKDLHDSLAQRNLTDIVDIVFVSDHGMTDTSHPESVYMDDILGAEGIAGIAHEDGWPSMGLRFHPHVNVSKHLEDLLRASDENPEKFEVYTHETMPERYHFANHERIAPIYVVPKIGYILTTHAEGDTGMSKGNHGYDNDAPSMQAIFVAHGPFSVDVKAQHQRRSQHAHLAARANTGWHSTSDDAYIMKPFRNVEIYNLVMKLLGVEKTASTNGTVGFWDQYL